MAESELRIVLVGKTGAGKSESGNTILQRETFNVECSPSSVTHTCEMETGKFDGQTLEVVDTPGLFDTSKSEEEVTKEISKCVFFAAPGPHVFLVVLQFGRFTKEEQDTVKLIKSVFGEEAARYTMVLFTHGDHVKAKNVDMKSYIDKSAALSQFISECHGEFHVFDNNDKDPSQVRELLEKINAMVQGNGGSFYTNEMFQEAQKLIAEEAKRNLRENPDMGQKEAKMLAVVTFTTSIGSGATIGAAVGLVGGPVGVAFGTLIGAAVGTLFATVQTLLMRN